jgi:uncharacterized membrane protein
LSPKALRIALAASVALNLFALAAGATVLVGRAKVEDRIDAAESPQQNRSPFATVVSRLDPQVRQRVRQTLKASALTVKPDFDEARVKRRAAVELAGSPNYDPARARTLLEESRAAELRGRAKLEADAVDLLATLDPADRQALSEILTRRGRIVVRDRPDGPPPAQAKAAD